MVLLTLLGSVNDVAGRLQRRVRENELMARPKRISASSATDVRTRDQFAVCMVPESVGTVGGLRLDTTFSDLKLIV